MGTAPRLEIREPNVEALGGDLYKVSVIVQNAGYLPTYVSEQAKKVGANKPVKVEIALGEGGKIVSGTAEQEVGHLTGRANQYGVLSWNGTFPLDSRAIAEWIVRQPNGGSVTITAATAKAGTATVEISLAME
jgi:hypothetical protein